MEVPDKAMIAAYGGLNYDDAIEVVEKHFKIDWRMTEGFQKFGGKRMDIAIKDEYFYYESIQSRIDEIVRLENVLVLISLKKSFHYKN